MDVMCSGVELICSGLKENGRSECGRSKQRAVTVELQCCGGALK
jgi:hypothetical protein